MIRLSSVFSRLAYISSLVLFLGSSAAFPNIYVSASPPTSSLPQDASTLLEQLTPEERVGQLFLITFTGTEVGPDSQVYDLITSHHIGGVVLLSKNNNIVENPENSNAPQQVFSLVHQFQKNEWDYSRTRQVNTETGESFIPAYVPLFIGISQEGDGYPHDQILHGVTTLPNEMAIGAGWNPDLAAQVGEVAGRELSSLGVNLIMGPTLDVLESPQLDATNNLGTLTFGGDPFWVGEMGRAYIRGLHMGSGGKIAVAVKHFPGLGSSDRLPEEEVATVRKTLDELKSFDLAPFFTVTGLSVTSEDTADALLVSHIRYQGLQGNIRATTRPISLDPEALSLLLGLPELNGWRSNGGVMISDDLSSQAVRRFYDLTSQTFDARRVALNAFLAGNDLLYIADFSSAEDPDSYTAAIRTLDFFAQKYREDSAFAQRVDESVERILALKFRIFQNFALSNVLTSEESLVNLGQSGQITFDVARQAATLISPSQADLDDTIPDPPNQNDRIVFVSDTRTAQQCSDCPVFPQLEKNALQDAVIRLYGPEASGQVIPNNLKSYSLEDLQAMLGAPPGSTIMEREMRRAHWIVFSMLNDRKDIPSFQTLRQFLTERPSLFQQKKLIVYVLSAPYFLDATNISKLTAYYALYSKAPQFVDVAAYLLFGELRAIGSSPVSVPGINYDINKVLFPDPNQLIQLELDTPTSVATLEATTTAEPTPLPEFKIGDTIALRTSIILDYNGNPVPDGTPVNFIFTIGGEANSVRQEQVTQAGIARTTYQVASSGTLEVYVESENARSNVLKLDIPSPNGEVVTITPTIAPTETPAPTATQTPIQSIPTPAPPESPIRPNFTDWLVAVLISSLIAWGSYRLATFIGQVRWGVRAGFLALIFGLLAYSYLALKLPGSEKLLTNSAARSVFLFSLIGALFGLFIVFVWRTLTETRHHHPNSDESI